MAQMAYLSLKGKKSGALQGGITKPGREHSIGVIAVSHEIIAARDPQTGSPTGRRQHKPLHVTKELDAATPTLLTMLATNEVITEWKLNFYDTNVQGVEKNNYRIELVNAQLISYQFTQPNVRDDAQSKRACYEELAFVYQKITWTDVDRGIVAADDWNLQA